jgi:phosphatidylserine/phosphatidylglycerophosphate/cardiolipin synthase-like enzyme
MTDISTFEAGKLSVYFNSKRAKVDGQLTSRLVAFIEATASKLDVAIYDLTAPAVLEALAKVSKRKGVTLRIAYDASGERPTNTTTDPKPGKTEQAITDAGLAGVATPVHLTGRHLMHNKFCIRDGESLWTGSANFTRGGLELQDNQCLEIHSASLASRYAPVFEDLVSKPKALAAPAPSKAVKVSAIPITAYYAPGAGEGVDQLCVGLIAQAKKIRVMAFVITDPDILGALTKFSAAKANYQAIVDPSAISTLAKIKSLDPSTRWWAKDPRTRVAKAHAFSASRDNDFMHNKVLILDDHLVVTGSYNLSENAEANDENLLLLDSHPLAAAYNAYFDAVYAGGKPTA